MQTFLPYRSFTKSARCLDNKRLGKQRVEAMQILDVLLGNKTAWKNHPAVLMWKGYDQVLMLYLDAVCSEWKRRGFANEKVDNAINRFYTQYDAAYSRFPDFRKAALPNWLGNSSFHRSHRSNLLHKDPVHYGQFKWNVPDNLPYVWPINIGSKNKSLQTRRVSV